MEYLELKESQPEGIVAASGSKNIALPLIVGSLLGKGITLLENVPDISDVRILLHILGEFHVQIDFKDNHLRLNTETMNVGEMPFEAIKKLRASYYLLGALLPQHPTLTFTYPGGCSFQKRPIDLHFAAIRSFGIDIEADEDVLRFSWKRLHGGEIDFPLRSVGATINTLFLACQVDAVSFIRHPSLDFEVREVIEFLNAKGAWIEIGQDVLIVHGKMNFYSNRFRIRPDRIEIGTFALIGAGVGKVLILNTEGADLRALLSFFDRVHIRYTYGKEYLLVRPSPVDEPVRLVLGPDPEMPTDLGPLLCAFLLLNRKICIIEDTIYPDRNAYVDELKKIGAKIKVVHHQIVIFPFSHFESSVMEGKDLRGTMSLILASLISGKPQRISGYDYLIRGYEGILDKLGNLNVLIRRIEK